MLISGTTIHLLFDLLLTFADVETHKIVRGFNGSESHYIRAAQLAFCVLVTCRGRQIRKSITSGVVDVFVTPDLNRPIFSVAPVVEQGQGHHTHFGGDSPGFIALKKHGKAIAANLPSQMLKEYNYIYPICLTSNTRSKTLSGSIKIDPDLIPKFKRWEVVYFDTSGP